MNTPGAAHGHTPEEFERLQEARFPVEVPYFGTVPAWEMSFTSIRVRFDSHQPDGDRWLSYVQDWGDKRIHAFTLPNLAHERDLVEFRERLSARLAVIQAAECPDERPGLSLSPVRLHRAGFPNSRMFAVLGKRSAQNRMMVSLRLLHAAKQSLADLAMERYGARS